MGFMKPKTPPQPQMMTQAPPPAPVQDKKPTEAVEENVDQLQEERLRRQRTSGRMATYLSQESQIGKELKL